MLVTNSLIACTSSSLTLTKIARKKRVNGKPIALVFRAQNVYVGADDSRSHPIPRCLAHLILILPLSSLLPAGSVTGFRSWRTLRRSPSFPLSTSIICLARKRETETFAVLPFPRHRSPRLIYFENPCTRRRRRNRERPDNLFGDLNLTH